MSRDHGQGRPSGGGDASPSPDERGMTRSEELSQRLEELILSGDLKPGDRLDEVALAAEYKVSRTPVREAIQRLVATGLVVLQPRKGPLVAVLPIPKLIGLFEMMAEFDVIGARLAARRATDVERAQLANIMERSRRAVDNPPEYARLNREFHWKIYAATHNEILRSQAIRFWKQLQPYRNFRLEQPERLRESLDQHEKIFAAIVAFNADEAAREMRNHVRVGGLIADFILTMPDVTSRI